MTHLLLSTVAIALAATAGAQKEENMPTQITSVEVANVRARYLNFKWDEEAVRSTRKGRRFARREAQLGDRTFVSR